MYRQTIILLLTLLLTGSLCIAQESPQDSLLQPSPDPLRTLLPVALYASYSANSFDESIRNTREALLGFHWRNHYDDYVQFVPYTIQLAMRAGGVLGRSRNWGEMLTADGVAIAGVAASVLLVKYTARRMRPDGSTANSFPSGHTATAFLGAELFNLEYGADYTLLAHTQYALATLVAVERIANNRHWYSDVLWGGVVGVSMVRLGYLVSDLLFGRYQPETVSETPFDSYVYTALLSSYHLVGPQTDRLPVGSVGAQIGYHTPKLSYALEVVGTPHPTAPTVSCDLMVGVPIYSWKYAHLRQSYGIGVGYDRASTERSYTHLQAGMELSPQVRYLDRLALALRLHYEPYRQCYLSLGILLRTAWH